MISKHTTGVTDEEINHRADKFSISSSGLSYREKLPESHDHNRISVKTYYVEIRMLEITHARIEP